MIFLNKIRLSIFKAYIWKDFYLQVVSLILR